ncbi:E3 Ubiquitin-Protein Ligase [Frankliniella occidentalis]|uniref:E3 ubiquitin-protein ligase RNF181 n=1 Tax=Frankliniella occidentalis TaxID=133901 RepID=A0A6J1SM24_FRAOC|nr:E3 ubiquitin-protein ligase RNF181 [Frankliniella occidentalis]XP_052124896.1 E3 ubiquitin-protein ligase RNF181 [Frankliniella occidentalis]XP_052124898.1 E3 ubiquitin-protein ligase RNF181 [Frankliniella occidentalis]KAE8745377.1 E3 Ubiquitin-Protein Ligase [Frankliniella occidentalis]
MADYFQEMNCTPLGDGETPNFLLQMARLLQDFGMWEELGTNKKLPPPASKKAVEDLKVSTVQREGDQCPVCLKNFDKGEQVKEMPCQHSFHLGCILPWLQKTNSCPLCRHELPTDDEEYENYKKEQKRAKQREEDIRNLHDSMFS